MKQWLSLSGQYPHKLMPLQAAVTPIIKYNLYNIVFRRLGGVSNRINRYVADGEYCTLAELKSWNLNEVMVFVDGIISFKVNVIVICSIN